MVFNFYTGSVVIDFMSRVHTGINEVKVSAGFFFFFVDVMKAFDTANHKILLYRMGIAGIRGVTIGSSPI